MTPERIEELKRHASEAKRLGGFATIHMAVGEVLALLDLAKAAIPSGQVANDATELRESLERTPWDQATREEDYERLARLAAQAQSTHEWFAKWEQAETLLNEYRAAASKTEAPREDRDAWQAIAEERLSALARIRSRAKDVERAADVYLAATQTDIVSHEGLAAALTWVLGGDGKAPEPRQGERPTRTTNDVRMWTMRDEFAAMALQGLLANPERSGNVRAFARDAVLFANALVETLADAQGESVEQAINGAKEPKP